MIPTTHRTEHQDREESLPASDLLLRDDPWKWWRQQMPVVSRWAYFDHAAVAPLPQPAVDAISEFAQEASQQGDTHWPRWNRTVENLRGQFAQLLAADPAEICLLPNTTTGINLVAEGLDWREGDNVVLPDGEFPSNLFPWLNQRSKGVDVRLVPRRGGRVDLDDLFARVDSRTRIISVSWVGYASGYRVDLDELVGRAHQKGVLVFVDAIQGLGIFDLDLTRTPIDFLAADGHKWMLGPEGAGMAMIRQAHLEKLRCFGVGWHSVDQAHQYANPQFELRDAAARFEGGSQNMVGMAALSASIDLFLQTRQIHGNDSIGNRVVALAETLDAKLRARGLDSRLPSETKHRSGIVTFDVPGADPAMIRQAALEKGIVVSCRGGGVRASLHVYHNDGELERLTDLAASFRGSPPKTPLSS